MKTISFKELVDMHQSDEAERQYLRTIITFNDLRRTVEYLERHNALEDKKNLYALTEAETKEFNMLEEFAEMIRNTSYHRRKRN